MNAALQMLDTGWQRHPALMMLLVLGGLLSAAIALVLAGPLAVALALIASMLCALGRLQWSALDGAMLRVRDLRSGFIFRNAPARQFDRVVFRRTWLPHCRVELLEAHDGTSLVLHAPSPSWPTLRSLTLWMIVHGRRRARIDPCLLDALAAMPEHEPARLPYDAHHA